MALDDNAKLVFEHKQILQQRADLERTTYSFK